MVKKRPGSRKKANLKAERRPHDDDEDGSFNPPFPGRAGRMTLKVPRGKRAKWIQITWSKPKKKTK
jgi:hypothetical protein